MKRSLKQAGFTYIELFIAISIIALTLAFSGPQFEQYTKTYRVKATAREIYTNLQLARLTAIKVNTPVQVTFGLINVATMTMTTGSSPAQVPIIPGVDFEAQAPGITLATTGSGVVTYTPSGTINAGDTQSITVAYSDPAITTQYAVVINAVGGIRLEKP